MFGRLSILNCSPFDETLTIYRFFLKKKIEFCFTKAIQIDVDTTPYPFQYAILLIFYVQ